MESEERYRGQTEGTGDMQTEKQAEEQTDIRTEKWTDIRTQKQADELAERLAADCFQIGGSGEFSCCGAEKERFKKEILFPDTDEAEVTVYAADYGVRAGVKENMRIPLEKAIEAVKRSGGGKKKLVLPSGEIYLYDGVTEKNQYAMVFSDIQDLSIDGNGSVLMLDMTLRGVLIEACESVLLHDLSFDRSELPYFTGKIITMDEKEKTALISVDEGCRPENHYPIREYLEFEADSQTPRYHGNFLYNNVEVDTTVTNIRDFEWVGEHTARMTFACEVTPAPKGTGVLISKTMYGPDTVAITDSANIRCENINIYCTPGMGIRGYSSENLFFNRTNVMLKPGSGRLMSVTADAMHFIDCKGELVITNTLIENSHDDAVNIHGMFQMVVRADCGRRRLKLAAARTVRFGTPAKEDPLTFPFRKGDKVELSRDRTLEYKQTLTVAACEPAEDFGFWAEFEEVPEAEEGDILSNISRSPEVRIENCVIRNKRNRGVLLQSRNSVIRNCTFYHVIMPAVCIATDCLNWYECLNARQIAITGNKFVHVNIKPNNHGNFGNADIDICVYGQGGVGKAGLISDIAIEGNAFIGSGNAAVSVKSAENVRIADNFIYKPCREVTDAPANCAVFAEQSERVSAQRNRIVPYEPDGFCETVGC